MNIYYINKNSRIVGPFDIIDAHKNRIIEIGDVCIRDTEHGLCFLLVVNDINKWNACLCIKSAISPGFKENMLLFSYNGVNKRYGKVEYLKLLVHVYSLDVICRFFYNAIDILTYKKDLWDTEIFLEIHNLISIKISSYDRNIKNVNIVKYDKSFPIFCSYFNNDIKLLLSKLQKEGITIKDMYLTVKKKYPTEFRMTLNRFLADHPYSTIYEYDTDDY